MTDAIREAVERCEKTFQVRANGVAAWTAKEQLKAADLSAILSIVRGVLPRPIEEAPQDGKSILAWGDPMESGENVFATAEFAVDEDDGIWCWRLTPESRYRVHKDWFTHFIPLSSLPLPQEEPHG